MKYEDEEKRKRRDKERRAARKLSSRYKHEQLKRSPKEKKPE